MLNTTVRETYEQEVMECTSIGGVIRTNGSCIGVSRWKSDCAVGGVSHECNGVDYAP